MSRDGYSLCRTASEHLASDPAKAKELLDQVLASEPGHAIATYYRIYALVNLRREAEALAAVVDLERLDRRAAADVRKELKAASGAKVSIANGHFMEGDEDAALAEYRSAAILDDHNWDAYTGMGIIAAGAGDYADALQHFDRALALSPDDISALYHRAVTYFQLGRLEDALADASKAIMALPDDVPLRDLRAEVYRSMGCMSEADEDARRADVLRS